jgi:hypothetical protein
MLALPFKSLKLSSNRILALVLMSSLLANGIMTTATAEDISITLNVQENQNPADNCVETPADWDPFVIGGNVITASAGQPADFQIDPNFSFGDGLVDGVCGTPIAPTGAVQAAITLTGNPAGWASSVDCASPTSCPTPDFTAADTQGINFIDASVTPPNVFGMAYTQDVVVTVTWIP